MSGLYQILQKIKDEPEIYIEQPSLSILRMFLVGYEFAQSELDIDTTDLELDFHENFHSWIEKKHNLRTSNSWANIIMPYTINEREGFQSFFKLLDEFLQRDKELEKKLEAEKVKQTIEINKTQEIPQNLGVRLYEVLEKIKPRPGMYIGSASLTALYWFLRGYECARRELGIEATAAEKEFHSKFQPWLQKRFNLQTDNSWAKIILLFSVNEKEALNSFYKLLDEFKYRDVSVDAAPLVEAQFETMLLEGLESGEPIEVTDEWWEQKRAQFVHRLRQQKQ
ncbi:hypothetical protein [Iningainema tapete]|uniref:Uncharacterized protein n=1 Tax=Iningainema tapete BLCC-T55 TaxID=2748662 RepID=A0A8J7C8U2_9CYAN|nr:hypothetical protein [Iningainema tapete]MBD2777194.1 hypothetical protein [Iningainema tapete BLCC-T55]